ncbi:MAG: YidC/Oxa1 family insertase periplasmic-domain containing protein [Planctomycetota bacterium]
MEKRLPLFLFLSALVYMAWVVFIAPPRQPREEQPIPAEGMVQPLAAEEPAAPPALVPALADAEERTEVLLLGADGEPGRYRLTVSNRGARIVALDLGSYYKRIGLTDDEKRDPENWARLLEPGRTSEGELGSLLLSTQPSSADLAPAGLSDVLWTMTVLRDADGTERGVEWRYGPGQGIVFVKRLTREPGTYRLYLELSIENNGEGAGRQAEFLLLPAGCVPPELGDKFYDEPRAIAVGYEDDEYGDDWESARTASGESGTLDVTGALTVAGVHNKYFAFLVRGADELGRASLSAASYRGLRDLAWLEENPGDEAGADRYVICDVNLSLRVPAPGETATYRYAIYAGPKDAARLGEEGPALALIPDTDLSGWSLCLVPQIGHGLLVMLRFFHGVFGNWGVAIIVLTICVRALLFPLNRRSQTAMARYQTKMKRVQPRIDEAKKKYEGNLQKQREEQARIMQEEGAFPPLGGCMPIFLQIPIFFGLFSALRTAFELRQAPFALWIDDLSRPDRLFEINLPLPLIGEIQYFNLLPILMVVLWVVQQMGMPKPSDEQAARMQKMMMFMPVVMGVFLYSYAAGLSLYMITQSGLGIIEQRVIKKLWPIDDTEAERKEKRGCGPFTGMMEEFAERQREELKRRQSGQPPRPRGDGGKRDKKKNRRL